MTDNTGKIMVLRAKETPEAYFYYRFRAACPQPVRDLLAARYGLPMGCFDPHESPEDRARRVATMAAKLMATGFALDASLVGGPTLSDQTPLSLQVVRLNQAPNAQPGQMPEAGSLSPEDYQPWPDMVVKSKPFSWLNEPPMAYLNGDSPDREGVGAIYQTNGKERYDVGARWLDGVKLYEKVKYAHHWGSDAVWERGDDIVLPTVVDAQK